MMFIRQNFGNSPSGWCEEGLRSKFSLGLYRLLGFAWIDGNTGLSAIDRLKMNACALSCELMAWGLDLWPQKRLWDVQGSGISRFLILKSVILTFERLLIMADSFGVLADTHQEVKHTSLWEVHVTICSYTACLDLQQTWSYSSFRTGVRGFNLVSEGEIWCREEGGGRLSHCESKYDTSPFCILGINKMSYFFSSSFFSMGFTVQSLSKCIGAVLGFLYDFLFLFKQGDENWVR